MRCQGYPFSSRFFVVLFLFPLSLPLQSLLSPPPASLPRSLFLPLPPRSQRPLHLGRPCHVEAERQLAEVDRDLDIRPVKSDRGEEHSPFDILERHSHRSPVAGEGDRLLLSAPQASDRVSDVRGAAVCGVEELPDRSGGVGAEPRHTFGGAGDPFVVARVPIHVVHADMRCGLADHDCRLPFSDRVLNIEEVVHTEARAFFLRGDTNSFD
mmetsp:Transcript_10826/g.26477  ORF Transcript_10826/g.26477 Transcript_10826/m.26477 type:complete len:211 (-) Transcript_10826:3659-4291(-)